ncbi:unnamed protein product [Staurois parvus]|uniref:Uncharacterized protein n=1 Tax=Staurois parvus TaxID=386267 RepID=A0ABN9C3F4_9NEOB|nr:unnamed protein product [Staurois parvus]
MQGPGGPDIMNAGSGGTRYSEMQGPGRPDIVNAGSGQTRYSGYAGSGETRYSECRVWGDQI